MNSNETSIKERSRRVKVTYERVVIDCEDRWGVFDANQADDAGRDDDLEPSAGGDIDFAKSVSDTGEQMHGGDHEKSAEHCPLCDPDCLVSTCASPDRLGDLEPSGTTPAYTIARALQEMRMLLHRMQRANGEPVTLKAVDVPSAA